jgi:hypothetical protein
MSIVTIIQEMMQGSAELSALLTGGIHAGIAEITRQTAPGAFDAIGEIKPCALIKTSTETKRGPYSGSVQTPVEIFVYQREGYDVIDDASAILFGLLNGAKPEAGIWRIEFDSLSANLVDSALECSLGLARFIAIRMR